MAKKTIEKLLDILPSYWAKHAATNTYEFLFSLALELDVVDVQITNLNSEIFIDTSTGTYLNGLARIFRLSRKSGETDNQLRARTKAYWPGFSGGGTLDAFKSTLNRITEVPESEITITEIDFMKVAINVVFDSEDDYGLADTITDTIQLIKAAGIYVVPNFILTRGPFDEAVGITESIYISTTPIGGYWVAGISIAGGTDVA